MHPLLWWLLPMILVHLLVLQQLMLQQLILLRVLPHLPGLVR